MVQILRSVVPVSIVEANVSINANVISTANVSVVNTVNVSVVNTANVSVVNTANVILTGTSNIPWINQLGRVRVDESTRLFQGQFFYGTNSSQWAAAANVAGGKQYNANSHGVSLSIAGNTGSKFFDISRRIFFYAPETAMQYSAALAFDYKANLSQFWGPVSFQANVIRDGFVIKNTAGNISFIKYSSSSGNIVQTVQERTAWYDPLTGAGPSGLNLDLGNLQMTVISYAWYGAGSALLSYRYNGEEYPAAIFNGSNNLTKLPIISNPHMSCMFGMEAIGTVADPPLFTHYGISVSSDGRDNRDESVGRLFSISNNITVSTTTFTPLLSIRPRATFSVDGAISQPNLYGYANRLIISGLFQSAGGVIGLIIGPVLAGSVFRPIPDIAGNDANSLLEYDTAATSITTGRLAYSKVSSDNVPIEIDVSELLLSTNSLGDSPVFTIAGRKTSGGSPVFTVCLNWREIY